MMSGCGSVYLHNQANEDIAKSAQKSFQDAKLPQATAVERATIKQLLDQELEAVRQNVEARRDLHLTALLLTQEKTAADGFWEEFNGELGERQKALMGDGPVAAGAPTVADLERELQRNRLRLQQELANYEIIRSAVSGPAITFPVKREIRDQVAKLGNPLATLFQAVEKAHQDCENKEAELAAASGSLGGLFGSLSQQIKAAEQAQQTMQAAVDVAEAKVKTAKDNLTKASLNPIDPKDLQALQDKVKAALAEFDAAADNMASAGEVLGLRGLADEARLKKIQNLRAITDAALGAMLTQDPDAAAKGAGDNKSLAAALTTIASTREFAEQLSAAQQAQRVAPLILAGEKLRVDEAAAERRLSLAQRRLDTMKQRRDAVLAEYSSLRQASFNLDRAKNAQISEVQAAATTAHTNVNPADLTLSAALAGRTPGLSDATMALLYYSEAWTISRAREEQLAYVLIAIDHESALDEAEYTLSQWDALIAAPLGELARVHAGGVRPEQISALIQAAGFTAVGIGVNR
jgi:hypothetical protein